MKIQYIATDLEFNSKSDLSQLVTELGDRVTVNLNEWVEDDYRVALGASGMSDKPETAVASFCNALEKLTANSKLAWNSCHRRVMDIAFESGEEPKCRTYELPVKLVARMSELGLSVAVTIYRVGFYSGDYDES